jgi:hypothetical protein
MSLRDRVLGKITGIDPESIDEIRRGVCIYRHVVEYVATRPQLKAEFVALLEEVITMTQENSHDVDQANDAAPAPALESDEQESQLANTPEEATGGFASSLFGKIRSYCSVVDSGLDRLTAATNELASKKITARNPELARQMPFAQKEEDVVALMDEHASFLDKAVLYCSGKAAVAMADKSDREGFFSRMTARLRQLGWTCATAISTAVAYAWDFGSFMVHSTIDTAKSVSVEMMAASVGLLYALANAPLLVWGACVWIYYKLVVSIRLDDDDTAVPAGASA